MNSVLLHLLANQMSMKHHRPGKRGLVLEDDFWYGIVEAM